MRWGFLNLRKPRTESLVIRKTRSKNGGSFPNSGLSPQSLKQCNNGLCEAARS